MIDAVDKRWEEFKELGEKEVRQHLPFWNEAKKKDAKAWLDHTERERESASKAETLSIQRNAAASASLAATSAADSARSAREALTVSIEQLRIAKNAKTIAMTAAIIAMVSIILNFLHK